MEDVFDLIAVPSSGVTGTGESQVLSEFKHLTIVLDTRGLKTLNFQPDPTTQTTVTRRSRRTVCNYFGWQINANDVDDTDDKETDNLKAKTVCDSLNY